MVGSMYVPVEDMMEQLELIMKPALPPMRIFKMMARSMFRVGSS